MTVAFDATSENASATPADPFEHTHTPVGTPKGVGAFNANNNTSTDKILALTYGGVALSVVQSHQVNPGENCNIKAWFLGASIPTGAQTVSADLLNTGSETWLAVVSLTAAGDTEIADSDILNTDAADPQIALQYGGASCLALAGIHSGLAAPSSLTEITGVTRAQEHDVAGTATAMVAAYQTTAGTSDFTIGWTGSSDDIAMIAFAVKEAAGAGAQTLTPSGIASAEAHGSATVVAGAVTIAPNAIASAEAFGNLDMLPGAVSVAPSGIAGAEAFGTPQLNLALMIEAILSGEAFGTAVLQPGGVVVAPSAIASDEAFGSVTVSIGTLFISPTAIESAEAHGDHTVLPGVVSLLPSGIAGAEEFGTLTVLPGGVSLLPDGIVSGEQFGAAALQPGAVVLLPTGVASLESFGNGVVVPGAVFIAPSGIAGGEQFGAVTILGGVQNLGRMVAMLRVMAAVGGTHRVAPSVDGAPAISPALGGSPKLNS